MPVENCRLNLLWKTVVKHGVNTISVGEVFRYPGQCIVVGCADGVVRIYDLSTGSSGGSQDLTLRSSLETKGGPIQQLALHDVTRFNSKDVVVADSRGMVTVFSNEQILKREAVTEECIHCLQVEQDALGNIAIVTSDSAGHICAFNPYSNLWRLRLSDMKQLKGITTLPQVKSLLSVQLANTQGLKTHYILAADNCQHVYMLHQGTVVMVTKMPTNITAMCSGYFIPPEDLEGSPSGPASTTQVALGGEQGAIYIMGNFQIFLEEFGNIKLPLTQLQTLPAKDGKVDSLLCAGHYNALLVLKGGKEFARHETPAWISSMVTNDPHQDGQLSVILSCLDNSIHALKVVDTS